ncbi:hypothetical protein L1987_06172 [Smallanthus sonchifolius]|uniref:Uncharacterized protein n=1 Tax=Smallanthus sonchifolius TaxID=185202 RepID=A0ACB9JXM3_9ASTR|nr:hypothetical protein L1987_06172 [Smallanthus sonchifolius]
MGKDEEDMKGEMEERVRNLEEEHTGSIRSVQLPLEDAEYDACHYDDDHSYFGGFGGINDKICCSGVVLGDILSKRKYIYRSELGSILI